MEAEPKGEEKLGERGRRETEKTRASSNAY